MPIYYAYVEIYDDYIECQFQPQKNTNIIHSILIYFSLLFLFIVFIFMLISIINENFEIIFILIFLVASALLMFNLLLVYIIIELEKRRLVILEKALREAASF